jgi:glycosyltransferase involved in cell wall biosynthesis
VIAYPEKEIVQDYTIKDGDGIIVHYLKNPFKFQIMSIFCLPKVIDKLSKAKGDVVHIHVGSLFSLFLILYLRFKRKKTVLTEHGIPYVAYWKQFKQRKSIKVFLQLIIGSIVEILYLNMSKRIIVDTIYVKKCLQNITFRKLNVIPQGINSIYYTLQDTPDSMALLSVGGISPRKGYEHSIEAIKILKQKFPKIHYDIIGICNPAEVAYLELLKEKIRELHLENNICIKTNVTFTHMLTFFEKANVFILHSLEESQGIVFCEAMAAGKPIVATNAGGIPYVVQNDINGKLSNFGDVNAFAENIAVIISDRGLRNTISTQNKMTAMRYSWGKIAVEVENLYA